MNYALTLKWVLIVFFTLMFVVMGVQMFDYWSSVGVLSLIDILSTGFFHLLLLGFVGFLTVSLYRTKFSS